jgi:hypothetical protein
MRQLLMNVRMQKGGSDVASSSGSSADTLASAINQSLDALGSVDMVLAATEAMERYPSANIWHALAQHIPSVQPALELSDQQISALAASRQPKADAGAIAPLSVNLFGSVAGLRRGHRSVLFEVGCTACQRTDQSRQLCAAASLCHCNRHMSDIASEHTVSLIKHDVSMVDFCVITCQHRAFM